MLELPDVPFKEPFYKKPPFSSYASPDGSVYRNGVNNVIFFRKKNKWVSILDVDISSLDSKIVLALKDSVLFDDFPQSVRDDIETFLKGCTDLTHVVFPNRGNVKTSSSAKGTEYY